MLKVTFWGAAQTTSFFLTTSLSQAQQLLLMDLKRQQIPAEAPGEKQDSTRLS